MLRGFRHTMFLLLQVGIAISGAIATWLEPDAWPAIAVCMAGSLMASLVCERVASVYLRRTLGQLRRAADDIGRGRRLEPLEAQPGDDFYKLIQAINLVATRLAEATSEEQRLHEQLRQRERLAFLGELAATVAHEVNNPLDGIQSCSRILRRSLEEPARAAHMLDLIDSGLERIHQIVRRLLTLARQQVIRPVEARVGDLVASALSAVESKFGDRGIVATLEHAAGEDDRAAVDGPLLEQVFVNLMTNAADSMPAGGTLSVRIEREAARARDSAGDGKPVERIRVSVRDSGEGIAPDVLPHIFEPFFTTKRGGRGTGLGLAIAARIVDAHAGSIDVDSQMGVGTTFVVHLPAADRASDSRGIDPTPVPRAASAAGRAHVF